MLAASAMKGLDARECPWVSASGSFYAHWQAISSWLHKVAVVVVEEEEEEEQEEEEEAEEEGESTARAVAAVSRDARQVAENKPAFGFSAGGLLIASSHRTTPRVS